MKDHKPLSAPITLPEDNTGRLINADVEALQRTRNSRLCLWGDHFLPANLLRAAQPVTSTVDHSDIRGLATTLQGLRMVNLPRSMAASQHQVLSRRIFAGCSPTVLRRLEETLDLSSCCEGMGAATTDDSLDEPASFSRAISAVDTSQHV